MDHNKKLKTSNPIDANHITKRLPDSELEVMQAVWKFDPPVPRAKIEQAMEEIHPIAQTTLLTHLSRLTEKGFLKSQKNGRSSEYTPLISQKDYRADQSRHFFDQLFGGNVSAFAAALCDSGLSKDDLQELRQLLEKNEL